MKKRQTLVAAISIALFLTACKKNVEQPSSTILGKWQETKVHLTQVINGVAKDTTLTGYPSEDYIIFSNRTDAVISQGSGAPESPGNNTPLYIEVNAYTYKIAKDILTFTSATGFSKEETLSHLDDKSLVLHEDVMDGNSKISTETYFEKQQ